MNASRHTQTFALGAEIMEQYFSCFPTAGNAGLPNEEEEVVIIDTTNAKAVAPAAAATPEATPEADGRDAVEEGPTANLISEAQQEVRCDA